jgi:DNA-binding SARP family transcriptional activator
MSMGSTRRTGWSSRTWRSGPGDSLSAERLADALWGEGASSSRAKVVQGCVVRLRRTLGRGTTGTTPFGYRLRVIGSTWTGTSSRTWSAMAESTCCRRLDAAEHQEVAAGAVLVGEEPWRERRWAILSLAQYRCGRQADALATIRKARGCLGAELGLDPDSDLVRLEQAILGQDPGLAPEHEARVASQRCPWKPTTGTGSAPWHATSQGAT